MQPDEISAIAALTAKQTVEAHLNKKLEGVIQETVKQTLIQMGVDVSDPLQMQRDFQHLRTWRETSDSIRNKSFITLIGLIVTGSLALILMGIKNWLQVR